jgi:putative transposase
MRRTNTFRVVPENQEQEDRLFELCELSAVFWNKITHKRRQSWFKGTLDWDTTEEYRSFAPKLGSATTQQLIRKNNEAWKSFFALLRKKKQEKLPPHIKKVRPPGYWKDRTTGKRILRTVIRTDCYTIKGRYLYLPKKLTLKLNGHQRWEGTQGRLELRYDELSGRWYASQPVECTPLHQPRGTKKAYIDLGVLNLLTIYTEGDKQAIICSGRPLLSEWWYWTKRIADHQSTLGFPPVSSYKLSRLYRTRKRRFRQVINTMIYRFVKQWYENGVATILVGDLTHIRDDNDKGKKTNAMTHNFWSFRYIVERLIITAENFGIGVRFIDESYTSQTCCLCGKRHRNGRKHRGLYVCKTFKKALNADVNGVANIANPIFPSPLMMEDRDNWVMAPPLIVSIRNG